MCPDGTLRPTGRSSKAQLEVVQLAKRLEELEGVLKDAGIGHRIPPPLDFEFTLGKGPDDHRAPPEDDPQADAAAPAADSLDGIMDGVGSLSIREEDGRTRFLGTSAGSAYFAAVSGVCAGVTRRCRLAADRGSHAHRATRIRQKTMAKTSSRPSPTA